jgi:hypothetical protein
MAKKWVRAKLNGGNPLKACDSGGFGKKKDIANVQRK